uniref:Cyclin N-terminal domain-containing protein n=1 Tax=Haptolina ericina TaxID=156174 RepID=A0A7S3EW08_9EUKA|mmetsp:Transcript_23840/g.54255  ORF Transcript_23840/g.54255 Transcript_23840/m.54255 type:complete len:460 (+) Transcript_23840:168-1547(+)
MQVRLPALHQSDVARLRIAANFLSSIELTAPKASDHGEGIGDRHSTAAGWLDPQRPPMSSERRLNEVRVVERRGSDNGGWQAAAALEFLSNLRLTSLHMPGVESAATSRGEPSAGWSTDVDGGADSMPVAPEGKGSTMEVAAVRVLTFSQLQEVPGASLARSRVLLRTSARGPPCLALSILRFEREDEDTMRRGTRTKPFVSHLVNMQRQRILQTQPSVPDGGPQPPVKLKGVAYGFVLHGEHEELEHEEPYDPYHLDDPELQSGKHRRVMNLPGLVESVIPFVKPHDLKMQLNEQFALKHQWLSQGLTLSKIRAVKRELLAFAQDVDCELSTVAVAYAYFEKLVLRNVVNKPNRKLMAAVSLILAAKWNEHHKTKLLMQQLERHYGIPRAVLFRSEFSVYVELAFRLQLEPQEVYPHFSRLLQGLERTPQEYLGETTFQAYYNTFIKPQRTTDDIEPE